VQALLALSRAIDAMNARLGKAVGWLIFAAVIVSSGNAVVRYIFDTSSNAWLELQWYLFAGVFLLGSGYTLLNNEHVRIDIIAGRTSARFRAWIDIVGALFFLLPMAVIIMVLSWPVFMESYDLHEISSDAGGLLRWPAKILIPVGFCLLALQGISELIKRFAFLAGKAKDPLIAEGEHHGEHAAD